MPISDLETRGRRSTTWMNVRLVDIEAFVEVVRTGSVTGAARALSVSAPSVSKAVARLERHIGTKLISRSPRGTELTDEGRRLGPVLADLLARARKLESSGERGELIVAAPSFLWTVLVPHLGPLLRAFRVHAIEARSNTLTAFAGSPFFDAALAVGEERWPTSWVKAPAGVVRRALFATPSKARELGVRVRREALRRELFVGRLEGERGHLVPAADGCPMPDRERRFGHRAQTVFMALELARSSNQLVFAPAIAARRYLQRRSLVEIEVEGWDVRDRLYVVAHQDRVEAKSQRALVAAARAVLGSE